MSEVSLDVNEVIKLACKVSPLEEVLYLEAVNVTPWAGGGFKNKTIEVIDAERGIYEFSLPSVETVKGVMRWVARAALNSVLNRSDLREVDKVLAHIFGGRVGGETLPSLITVIVEEELSNRSRLEEELRILRDVMRKLSNLQIRDITKLIQCIAFYTFNVNRDLSPEDFYRRYCAPALPRRLSDYIKGKLHLLKDIKDSTAKTELIKAYSIPRVTLKLMGARDLKDLIEALPIPPNYIRLRIQLHLIRNPRKTIENSELINSLKKFVALTLIYTLMVAGIGGMTSRGFGRFRITKVKCRDDELCQSIIKYVRDHEVRPKETIEGMHTELTKLAVNVIKVIEHLSGKTWGRGSESKRIPSLSQDNVIVKVIENPRHIFPGLPTATHRKEGKPVNDVWEVLSAIGFSTLKVIWKVLSGLIPAKKYSGIGFHTWILGLPRWQQETGYAILDFNEFNTCVNKRKLKSADPGRRSSSIVLYPVIAKGTTKVVIIDYVTLDDHLSRILSKEEALHHVGRHGDVKNPIRHVVRLNYAMTQKSIRSDCGYDYPAGIMTPSGRSLYTFRNISVETIKQLHEVALKFIEYALR